MKFIAHRGESYIAPENTLAAIKLAWEKNDDGVEIDIHLSRDNRIMVMHDGCTGRASSTNLVIAENDSEKLRKLDVGSYKGEKYAGEKIPFLDEVLETVPAEKVLLVEIKAGLDILPGVKRAFEESGKTPQIIVIGFDLEVIAAFKKLMPEVPTLWLGYPGKDDQGNLKNYDLSIIDKAVSNGLDGFDLFFGGLTQEFVDAIRAAGLQLHVWTVDEIEEAKRVIAMGIDGLTTNRADWIRENLGR
jgi:glycerophosphoryl diester phosphodiesterase